MKKEWEDIITKEMGVEPIRINSNLVSAQNRERLYWTNVPNVTQPEDKKIKLSDVLTDDNFREVPKCFYNKWGTKERINKNPNWIWDCGFWILGVPSGLVFEVLVMEKTIEAGLCPGTTRKCWPALLERHLSFAPSRASRIFIPIPGALPRA